MQHAPLIALLTDFGLSDPYVGQMRSVLLAAAPGVPLVDISHGVAPQDVAQAAFFLAATLPWLPPAAVVVAVVDPGVGTERRVALLELGSRCIVAPDNGLLTLVLDGATTFRAFDATPRVTPASATFHGRDVFAPLAARLAMGEPAAAFGCVLAPEALARLPGLAARRQGDRVTARVLSVDHFGNVVTSCAVARFEALPAAPRLLAPVSLPLAAVRTYAAIPADGVGLLAGSQGYLELAVPGGSAAARLGVSRGDTLIFSLPQEGALWGF